METVTPPRFRSLDQTHILIHGELPLPPRELADGDDGGEGDARDQHHVETCE